MSKCAQGGVDSVQKRVPTQSFHEFVSVPSPLKVNLNTLWRIVQNPECLVQDKYDSEAK